MFGQVIFLRDLRTRRSFALDSVAGTFPKVCYSSVPTYPELSIAIVLKSTRIRVSCNMKLIPCYALKTYSAV